MILEAPKGIASFRIFDGVMKAFVSLPICRAFALLLQAPQKLDRRHLHVKILKRELPKDCGRSFVLNHDNRVRNLIRARRFSDMKGNLASEGNRKDINSAARAPKSSTAVLLAFFLTEFVVVFLTLFLLGLVHFGNYSPFAAGLAGGIAAAVGSAVFWGIRGRKQVPI
jgi:hypothetical protein